MNTSSGKIFDLLNGKPAKAPNSDMSYVDVRDVAALHIAAAQTKAEGKRVMANAGSMHHRKLCEILKAARPTANVPSLVEGDAEDKGANPGVDGRGEASLGRGRETG